MFRRTLHLACSLTCVTLLTLPLSVHANNLNNWGAAYAKAEQQRQLQELSRMPQGVVAPEDDGTLPPAISDRQAAIEFAKVAVSFLAPGVGLVIWMLDRD